MPITALRVDARPVALARILIGIAYLVCLFEVIVVLYGVAEGRLAYPAIRGFGAASESVVSGLLAVGFAAGVLLIFGVVSSTAAISCLIVLVVCQLLDQQTYSNHLILCTLLLAYLVPAKSGSRWSFDARLRGAREMVPWWTQLLMMSQVSICYFFAGLSKANPRFLSGQTLPESLWIEAPQVYFQVLAAATICAEIFIGVGLWIRRVRVLAVIAGAGLHLGILATFSGGWVTFAAFALLCVSTYWMFLVRPQLSLRAGVLLVEGGASVVSTSPG